MVIAVTESNNVYALHANDGTVDLVSAPTLARRSLQGFRAATSVRLASLAHLLSISRSRSLFFDAMIDGVIQVSISFIR